VTQATQATQGSASPAPASDNLLRLLQDDPASPFRVTRADG